MSQFIQLHLLTNYAPSNLNRDDLGRPKTAKMGGFDRLRISSQSLKRAWRTSDVFESSLSANIGIRTKKLGVELYNYFLKKDITSSNAKKWGKEIAKQFGKLKKEDKEKPQIGMEIEQLVHISPWEKEAIYKLADILIAENRAPEEKKELALLRKKTNAVDIALFGRMLASSPENNVEAAAQVAHAITVNRITVEDDYFTALDDLNTHEEDAGSAHIGESGFGSGIFYIYICINTSLLLNNLGNDALVKKSIQALTKSAAIVAPTGKQNSYASRARALFVMAEKGTQHPRQLSAAFLKPVDSHDMAKEAITRLIAMKNNMDQAYGKCSDDFRVMQATVDKFEGSLEDILAFVGEE